MNGFGARDGCCWLWVEYKKTFKNKMYSMLMQPNQIRSFEYIAELRGQDSSGNWHSIKITEASLKDIWDNRALIHEAGQFIFNESFTYDRIRLNISSPSGSGISSPVSILKDGKQVLYKQWMAEDILKRKSNT